MREAHPPPPVQRRFCPFPDAVSKTGLSRPCETFPEEDLRASYPPPLFFSLPVLAVLVYLSVYSHGPANLGVWVASRRRTFPDQEYQFLIGPVPPNNDPSDWSLPLCGSRYSSRPRCPLIILLFPLASLLTARGSKWDLIVLFIP